MRVDGPERSSKRTTTLRKLFDSSLHRFSAGGNDGAKQFPGVLTLRSGRKLGSAASETQNHAARRGLFRSPEEFRQRPARKNTNVLNCGVSDSPLSQTCAYRSGTIAVRRQRPSSKQFPALSFAALHTAPPGEQCGSRVCIARFSITCRQKVLVVKNDTGRLHLNQDYLFLAFPASYHLRFFNITGRSITPKRLEQVSLTKQSDDMHQNSRAAPCETSTQNWEEVSQTMAAHENIPELGSRQERAPKNSSQSGLHFVSSSISSW
jgi:hypothetical protein